MNHAAKSKGDLLHMRGIQIDLAQPFEEVLATVLSLPAGCSDPGGNRLENGVELKRAIHGLHEAANGRQVETKSSRVAIAPPIAAFLNKRPFHVATQVDFLIAAAARLICGPLHSDVEMRSAKNELPAPRRGDLRAPSGRALEPRGSRRFFVSSRDRGVPRNQMVTPL